MYVVVQRLSILKNNKKNLKKF